MANEHHRSDFVGYLMGPLEYVLAARSVQVGLDDMLAADGDSLERLAGPPRARAQHQIRRDPLPVHVGGDRLDRATPAWGKRAIVIGQPGVVPARLGVPKNEQSLARRHPDLDSAACGGVNSSCSP